MNKLFIAFTLCAVMASSMLFPTTASAWSGNLPHCDVSESWNWSADITANGREFDPVSHSVDGAQWVFFHSVDAYYFAYTNSTLSVSGSAESLHFFMDGGQVMKFNEDHTFDSYNPSTSLADQDADCGENWFGVQGYPALTDIPTYESATEHCEHNPELLPEDPECVPPAPSSDEPTFIQKAAVVLSFILAGFIAAQFRFRSTD